VVRENQKQDPAKLSGVAQRGRYARRRTVVTSSEPFRCLHVIPPLSARSSTLEPHEICQRLTSAVGPRGGRLGPRP
jgi:hypothetical protein